MTRRRGRGRGRGPRLPDRGSHRRRAAAAARRLSADAAPARCRQDRADRDRRSSQHCAGARRRDPHHGREVPRVGRVGEERLVESGAADARRRGEVRHRRSRRLRVRARRRRSASSWRRTLRPCCSRRCTASSTPKQLAEWVLADRLPVRVQLQVHKYIWSPRDASADRIRDRMPTRGRAAERRARFLHGRGRRAGATASRSARSASTTVSATRSELEAARAVARGARRRHGTSSSALDLSRSAGRR